VARNAPDPESPRPSSRVTKTPVQRQQVSRPPKTRQDRKRFWLQVICGLLVLAMMLPVVAFLFT